MKLAIECKPYPDETLTSWIIRNSIANGTDPKSFALSVFHKHSTWYKDIDRHIDKEQLQQLINVTSLSKQQIIDLTLKPLIIRNTHPSLAHPFKWAFIIPMGIKGNIQTSGLYFCSECLKGNNPYIRKQWKLAWNIACPIHKKLLAVHCPNCNQVFSPHLITYDYPYIRFCTNCGYDLSKVSTKNVFEEVLSFQNKLSNIATGSQATTNFPLLSSNSVELFLTLEKLLSFIKYAYAHEKYNPFFKHLNIDKVHMFERGNNQTFSRLCIEDRQFLLFVVSRLFKLDIKEIITLLQKTCLSRKTFLKTSVHLSETITYIANQLTSKKIFKPPRKVFKKIQPNSLKEVNRLFTEIEAFIKKDV